MINEKQQFILENSDASNKGDDKLVLSERRKSKELLTEDDEDLLIETQAKSEQRLQEGFEAKLTPQEQTMVKTVKNPEQTEEIT